MFNLLQTFRSSLIGVLMLFVVWQLCANQALAQSIPTNDPTKLGYICQGDPQPTGYSVVGVSAVPSLNAVHSERLSLLRRRRAD